MTSVARVVPTPATSAPSASAAYASGSVRIADGETLRVDTEAFGLVSCHRAASCLLEPIAGDRVAVFLDGAEGWVVAVLRRSPDASADIVLEADATVRTRGGSLTLEAPEAVTLRSAGEIRTVSQALQMVASKADLALTHVRAVGASVESHITTVRQFAERCETFAASVAQHVGQLLRVVEKSEVVRGGRLDYRAEGLASIQGSATLVNGQDVVKVDGRQIQLG